MGKIDIRKSESLLVKLDENKKLLIISDLHLGHKFNKQIFEEFVKIFSQYDLIVINGDFWADTATDFDKFVKSQWSQLFPILKNKTIYIFGNHDDLSKMDNRVNLFSKIQGYRLKLTHGKNKFHIEHGQLLSSKLAWFLMDTFRPYPKLLHLITLPLLPLDWLTKYYTYQKIHNKFLYDLLNTKYKKQRLQNSHQTEIFVMGHTHLAEYDKELNYVNTGFSHLGNFSYLESENNKIKLLTYNIL